MSTPANSNPLEAVVSQWLSGNPGTDSPGDSTEETGNNASDSEEYSSIGSENVTENLTPPDQAQPAEKQTVSPDRETIVVTDDKGKRKVEIDYTDKKAIRKAFEIQHGARKWQVERDKALEAQKSIQSELEQIRNDWSTLDAAYQKGPEHLFDTLAGKQGAFREYVGKQLEKEEFLRNASPEELRAHEAQERAAQHQSELERIRKENEEFRKQVAEEREQAEYKQLEGRVHPAFSKHRFAGTLGNPDDEQYFDRMLWTSAMERLIPFEEKGVAITPELAEREFRAEARLMRSKFAIQAEKRAAKAVEQKKQEATENVQSKVMNQYNKGGSDASDAQKLLEKNDIAGIFRNWGKYGRVFGNNR